MAAELRFPDPYVFALNVELSPHYCTHCLQRLAKTQIRCETCYFVVFCSEKCQREAKANYHEEECERISKFFPVAPATTTIFYGRLIGKLIKDRVNITEVTPAPSKDGKRRWESLISHSEELKQQTAKRETFKELKADLTEYFGQLPVSEEEFWVIYCKKLINAHNIRNADGKAIGFAIDLEGSAFDHCCSPNVAASFHGKTLVFRSLDPNKRVDAKYSFIRYLPPGLSASRRQQLLRLNYCFHCNCSKCSHGLSDEE